MLLRNREREHVECSVQGWRLTKHGSGSHDIPTPVLVTTNVYRLLLVFDPDIHRHRFADLYVLS